MLLAGPEGSGKSHLAAIWAEACRRALDHGACADRGRRAGRAGDRRAGGRGSQADELRRTRAVSSAQPRARGRRLRPDHGAHAACRLSRSNCAICARGCARCRWCRCCRRTTSCSARLIVKFCADRQLAVDESRGQLSRNPDRAVLCGRAAGCRAARQRGAAAGPASHPGAGGGTACATPDLSRWLRPP